MSEVRKHRRKTASGKTTTVRRHFRNAGGAKEEEAERARQAWQDRASAPYVGSLAPSAPAAPAAPAQSWWDEDEPDDPEMEALREEMRDWRALPEPEPPQEEPMTPEMARLLGCDTPDGLARYRRLSAWRTAGYTGPLNAEACIPDPDDPANVEWLRTAAAMRRTRHRG